MARAPWRTLQLVIMVCFGGRIALAQPPRRPTVPVVPREPAVVDSLRRARADSLRADSLRARRAVPDTLPRSRRDTSARAVDDSTEGKGPDPATLRLRDSLLAALRGDTVRTAFSAGELPVALEREGRWFWSREQIAATGAVTLADLLERVPGVTTFRGGWLNGISAAGYAGDVGRVRVFQDGVALDPTDQRAGGVLDLTDIPLWLMQDVTVERGAAEVRVWLRTWSQSSTVPYTRVEVNSGDLQTNRFAGVFGKRFKNGAGFQLGAQQVSTSGGRSAIGSGRGAGDGSHEVVFARAGWARGWLSVDGMMMGNIRIRDSLVRTQGRSALPRYDGQRRDSYLRIGFRSPDSTGFWAQVVGGTLRTSFVPVDSARAAEDSTVARVVPDSSRWTTQLVSTVGYRMGAWRLSATQRGRTAAGLRTYSPAARVSWERPWLALSAYAERSRPDSTERTELAARLAVRPWLVLTGAAGTVAGRVSQLNADTVRSPTDTSRRLRAPTLSVRGLAARGEANLRLGTTWLRGGVLRQQDTMSTLGPRLLGDTALRFAARPATGFYGGIDTPVWKAIRLSAQATRWGTGQLYRPQTQTRAELSVQTRWLRRFPLGDFGLNTRLSHEYRGAVQFIDSLRVGTTRLAQPNQAISFLLELRLKTAVLGWSYRFSGNPGYQLIPGLPMPRPLQYYGVRWEFWN
jgi:hypothetical protein